MSQPVLGSGGNSVVWSKVGLTRESMAAAACETPLSLTILYADDALLALHKPAGLLCVPGRGPDKQDSLASRVQTHWPEARVVHRLDQATSGLVLMARSAHWQRALSALFETRQIRKTYLAAVAGQINLAQHVQANQQGWRLIDLPLAADWPRRPRQRIEPQGKPSQTRWRLLARCNWLPDAHGQANGSPPLPHITQTHTWLEVEPLTGRTHQIRVHLSAIGHPIVGDALYAPACARANAAVPSVDGPTAPAPRLMLHAARLAFVHPSSQTPCVLEASSHFV
jgi:tRNA pseudouridine32 synthase / 23S rRNA pseudouridine746 synthase